MTNFFDYVYYRVKKKFYRKDSDGVFAACCVAFLQVGAIVDLVLLVSRIFYTRNETAPYSKVLAQIVAGIFIIVAIFHTVRYYRKYYVLAERWKDETKRQQNTRGWLVFFAVLAPLVILILGGIFL